VLWVTVMVILKIDDLPFFCMHESKKTNLGLWGKDSQRWVFFLT